MVFFTTGLDPGEGARARDGAPRREALEMRFNFLLSVTSVVGHVAAVRTALLAGVVGNWLARDIKLFSPIRALLMMSEFLREPPKGWP